MSDRRQEVLNGILQLISEYQQNTEIDVMIYTYDDWLAELKWLGYPMPDDTFGAEQGQDNE